MAEILKQVHISDAIHYLGQSHPIPVNDTQEASVSGEDDHSALLEKYRQQGFIQGQEQARREMAEHITRLHALLASIPQAVCDNRKQMASEIADIVFSIVQPLFIHQQQDPDSLSRRIEQSIQLLNSRHNLELSLHPDDIQALKQGELNLDLQGCKNLKIVSDDSLHLGGCLIKSEHGLFDAGLERQIDNLKQVLLRIKNGERHDELG
ncbi:FliH/SctL family protein [Legionella sp. CNM-4043-24]|uniref:FliH/SctL family protein n=1 Tax=Legionella sp. CNM-4043-24 TaxID=3421646 RepID=UPI00403B1A12